MLHLSTHHVENSGPRVRVLTYQDSEPLRMNWLLRAVFAQGDAVIYIAHYTKWEFTEGPLTWPFLKILLSERAHIFSNWSCQDSF